MRKCFMILLPALLLVQVSCSCGSDKKRDAAALEDIIDWSDEATESTDTLIATFWSDSLSYFLPDNNGGTGFQYWPQAHALDVVTDAFIRTGDTKYVKLMNSWLYGVKKGNGDKWKNDYYDDMEWIALALQRAYKATGEQKFLDVALHLWGFIEHGWNDYAGGGIAWRTQEPNSKNACSNGPACILAARLYQSTGKESYKKWAIKIYQWEKSKLVDDWMVLDHINGLDNSLTKWEFTYNQGTFIGSAVELYRITKDAKYLSDAVNAADRAISSMSVNSVLKLEGSPDSSKDNDAHLFKGILIRYMDLLASEVISTSSKTRYSSFITANAESLLRNGTGHLYGPDWGAKPGPVTTLKSDVSACTLLECAAN